MVGIQSQRGHWLVHGVVMRKGGCVRAYVRGVRTWAWPGRVRARVRAHVLTRVRAPELTNIPLHMRRRQHFFWDVQSDNDGDWSWRGRWCVGIGPSVRPSDLALRPVRGRVGAWVCGCVGAWVWVRFLVSGTAGTYPYLEFLGLSYNNKVHQGKWPCAARLIFLWRHSITAREADLP